jgi:hypothetical protein
MKLSCGKSTSPPSKYRIWAFRDPDNRIVKESTLFCTVIYEKRQRNLFDAKDKYTDIKNYAWT